MDNIEKILKKLSSYEKDSRNHKKYSKILQKHIKNNVHYFVKKTKENNLKIDVSKVNELLEDN